MFLLIPKTLELHSYLNTDLLPHGSDSNAEFENPNFHHQDTGCGRTQERTTSAFRNTVTHTNRPKRLEWSQYQIQTALTLPVQDWNSNTS
jgi:hypothetical protein